MNLEKKRNKLTRNVKKMAEQVISEFKKACNLGQLEAAQALFEANPEVDIKSIFDDFDDIIGDDVFCDACMYGLLPVVEWLFRVKPFHIRVENNAFGWACIGGRLEVAQKLLEWNLTCDGIKGKWIISETCSNGHLHVLQWLLQVKPGWNIYVDDELFETAYINGYLEIMQWIVEVNPEVLVKVDDAFKSVCDDGYYVVIAQWLQSINPERYKLELDNDTGLILSWSIVVPLTLVGTVTMPESEIKECPICYNAQSNVRTSCGHQFCRQCIEQLENKTKCSYCRAANITFQEIAVV